MNCAEREATVFHKSDCAYAHADTMSTYTTYLLNTIVGCYQLSCAYLLHAGRELLLLSHVAPSWDPVASGWEALAGVQGELVPCTLHFAPSWTVRQCRSSRIKSAQLAVNEPLRNLKATLR